MSHCCQSNLSGRAFANMIKGQSNSRAQILPGLFPCIEAQDWRRSWGENRLDVRSWFAGHAIGNASSAALRLQIQRNNSSSSLKPKGSPVQESKAFKLPALGQPSYQTSQIVFILISIWTHKQTDNWNSEYSISSFCLWPIFWEWTKWFLNQSTTASAPFSRCIQLGQSAQGSHIWFPQFNVPRESLPLVAFATANLQNGWRMKHESTSEKTYEDLFEIEVSKSPQPSFGASFRSLSRLLCESKDPRDLLKQLLPLSKVDIMFKPTSAIQRKQKHLHYTQVNLELKSPNPHHLILHALLVSSQIP